jgi:hypothetical protein
VALRQRATDRPREFSLPDSQIALARRMVAGHRVRGHESQISVASGTVAGHPVGPDSPHKAAQGKRRKLMDPAPWTRFHPFVATLERWATGVPVDCGDPWTPAAIATAVARGPHTSALTPEARLLITDEVDYQVQAGFSEILAWTEVQALQPPNLKVSPLAVIPQVGRWGRLLLDLSFARGPGRARRTQTTATHLAPSVNNTTTKQLPD